MVRWMIPFIAALMVAQAAAAEPPAPLLEQFTGEWSAEGVAFGAPAQSRMVWAPALGGKFLRLDYSIEMTRESGTSLFEGAAYYRLNDGEAILAFWADNSGDLHPITASRDGDALISVWGVEGGKQGRTRYELLASGEMQVTDWIKMPNGWRQFNQGLFTRVVVAP